MKVAFQGEPGAYSEQAIFERWQTPETLPCETFDAVFEAVTSGQAQAGLIPIENSLAGSIHQNYDLLLRYQLPIAGEHFLRVRHCLIGLPGASKDQLRRVRSHPQALGQCAAYLRSLNVKTEPVYDTAGSVKLLQTENDPSVAAIASRRAANLYGMEILEEGIEDNPENYTRFLEIRLTPPDIVVEDAKTSIVFTLKNSPGALFKALSVFALRDIDLTKIESRPLAGKPWEYLFYVDFLGATQTESARRALSHLEEYALLLRVLGCYPRARLP